MHVYPPLTYEKKQHYDYLTAPVHYSHSLSLLPPDMNFIIPLLFSIISLHVNIFFKLVFGFACF